MGRDRDMERRRGGERVQEVRRIEKGGVKERKKGKK